MKPMLPLLALALLVPSSAHAAKSENNLQDNTLTVAKEEGKKDALTGKMEHIMFADLQFQDAPVEQVLNALSKLSQPLDTTEHTGVSIVYKKPNAQGNGPARDPFGGAAVIPGTDDSPRITLQLRHVSMLQALNLICDLTDCTHAVENGVVVVRPKPKANAPAK